MHTATTSGEIHLIVTSWFLRKKTKPVRVEIIPVKNKRRTQKSGHLPEKFLIPT